MPWPSKSRRPLLWLALTAMAVGFVLPARAADPPCGRAGAFTHRVDGWTEIRLPTFTSDGSTVEAFAVVDGNQPALLASNGTNIARSDDGGCTWREVHQGTPAGNVGIDTNLNDVVVLDANPVPRLALMTAGRFGDRVVAATRTVHLGGRVTLPELGVLHSDDGGRTWSSETEGLPANAEPLWLRTSYRGLATYLLVADLQNRQSLYLSADGGRTWSPRATETLRLTGFEVDPVVANRLWAWEGETLYRSDNAGLTFSPVPGVQGRITAVDVRRLGGPPRVTVFTSDPDFTYVSVDDGRNWSATEAPGTVRGVDGSVFLDLTVTAADSGVHLIRGVGGVPQDVTPRRVSMEDVWVSPALPTVVYGYAQTGVYRLDLGADGRPIVRAKKPKKLARLETGRLNIKKSVMVPGREEIVLGPGETRTVEYRLDMAPFPTPLDVYFMTDSTGSMDDLINGVRTDLQAIVDELAYAGIDAWYGLADFKDYPAATSPTDYPYRRLKKLGPPGPELEAAINGLQTGGGSGQNSALAALREAALGPGQKIIDNGAGGPDLYYVQPGQDAGWRPGALHVVVLAADVAFSKPGPDYPGPSFQTAVAALNDPKVQAKFIGLAVGATAREAAGPRPDMETVAEGTESFAPPGGVDCDDNGEVDIAEGEELVCSLVFDGQGETRVAPALLGMIQGVQDFQPLSLTLDGNPARARMADAGVSRVNVKTANRFFVPVTYSCPRAEAESRYDYRIAASVRATAIADATTTLVCKPQPAAVVPPIVVPPVIPRIAVAVAPPPPAPPAPVTQVNPNPNPNPNPQPNVGAAAEEQKQPQLALAELDDVIDDQQELAMSARSTSQPDPSLALAAAVLTALAGGAAVRSRTRTAPAAVRRTRT